MCWIPESCTDRANQRCATLCNIPGAQEPDVPVRFLHTDWPGTASFLTNIMRPSGLQRKPRRSERTHTLWTHAWEPIDKISAMGKTAGSLIIAFSGNSILFCANVGIHYIHQSCSCTHGHPEAALDSWLQQSWCSTSSWSALWKNAGLIITWCTSTLLVLIPMPVSSRPS